MPRDNTAANNEWPNELLCRWWEAVCRGLTTDPPLEPDNPCTQESMLPARQIAAEAWAASRHPELLQASNRLPPRMWVVDSHSFTTSKAASFYSAMRQHPGYDMNARSFSGVSPERQEQYMVNHWTSVMGEEYPQQSPWVGHRRGPYNRPGLTQPHLVHGWRFGSTSAADYFTTMLNLHRGDTEAIALFRGRQIDEQEAQMEEEPLDYQSTPVYPTQEEAMSQLRNSDGTFAKTPKKRRSLSLGEILTVALRDAVQGRSEKDKPSGKKPRSSPDKIMRHFKNRYYCPELYKTVPGGVWRPSDEIHWVGTDPLERDKYQPWEKRHAESHAIRCHCSRQWYTNNFTFVEIVEHRGTVSEEQNARDHGYCQWADGRWHDRRPPPTPEERQAEIRRHGGNNIPQYHQIRPSWRDDAVSSKEPLYGIEVELQSKKRREICTIAEELGFIGEQDGTLCRETGLEIIAPPFTFDQIRDKSGKWMTFLKNIQGQVRGWDAGTNYGMHISISREMMKRDHQARLMCFIHDSQPLCESVAGREANQWCTFKKKPRDESCLIPETLPDGRPDKYESCCVRGEHRIEMRIFRSTVSVEGFMRNVEFTVASVDYTRDPPKEPSQERFLEWAREQEQAKKYPNLLAFLNTKGKDIKPPKTESVPEPPQTAASAPRTRRSYLEMIRNNEQAYRAVIQTALPNPNSIWGNFPGDDSNS